MMTYRSFLIGAMLLVAACSEGKDDKTADDVDPCVKSSARTAGTAAKTGGETAVEGVKTLGDSIGGLFEGGKEEAKRRWQQGKQQTKATAKSGGEETKATAAQDECKK
ncbi:MAG: hypothetical protein HOV80_28805 [Polyangiaceae bacterium]|nr:hypothetical protein [Polyangiaceae bacterium]